MYSYLYHFLFGKMLQSVFISQVLLCNRNGGIGEAYETPATAHKEANGMLMYVTTRGFGGSNVNVNGLGFYRCLKFREKMT